MNKLKQIWSNLRSSFWFVPSLIVAVSIALAVALVEADSTGSEQWIARWPRLFGVGAPDRFDIYYGMADNRIGAARLNLPENLPPAALADGDRPKTGGQE